MNQSPVTIALVEDDLSLRETLAEIIASDPAWKLTDAFSSAEEALEILIIKPPQVVLMDIQLPGMSGIECVYRLKVKWPDVHVMMVTVYDNNDRIYDALAAGANGYLLKRDVPDKLLESLDELIEGGSPMSRAIARKVVQHFRKPAAFEGTDHDLTSRETQILMHLSKGALYKEIASDLGIGFETVRSHLRSIYAKLQVRTRTEAVVKYLGGT